MNDAPVELGPACHRKGRTHPRSRRHVLAPPCCSPGSPGRVRRPSNRRVRGSGLPGNVVVSDAPAARAPACRAPAESSPPTRSTLECRVRPRPPSITMLSAEHFIATVAVRKAMRTLRAEGLIFTVAGYGTFVSDRADLRDCGTGQAPVSCRIASATGAVRAGGSRPHGRFRSPTYRPLPDASGQWRDQSGSGGCGCELRYDMSARHREPAVAPLGAA